MVSDLLSLARLAQQGGPWVLLGLLAAALMFAIFKKDPWVFTRTSVELLKAQLTDALHQRDDSLKATRDATQAFHEAMDLIERGIGQFVRKPR